ncbi:unnamed protein product [Linum trigynum]|uniref:Uncharacterized protein n=1 Tax=Linum trigynum TaxID=586398 RepID=A0AAV2G6L7_9ROSI
MQASPSPSPSPSASASASQSTAGCSIPVSTSEPPLSPATAAADSLKGLWEEERRKVPRTKGRRKIGREQQG